MGMSFRSGLQQRLAIGRTRLELLALLATVLGAISLLSSAPAMADVEPFEVNAYTQDFEVSADKAEETLETQQQAAGVVDQLQGELGGRYAGVWFDNASGEFVVPMTAGASQAAVHDQFAEAGLGGDVRTVPAQSSWDKLEAAQEAIDGSLLPLIRESLMQTSIDPRTNSVTVRVAAGASEADMAQIQDLAASAGVQVSVEQVTQERFDVETSACKTSKPRACDRPLRGGVSLTEDTAAFHEVGHCTAGFKATGPGGSRYILTAGHCAAAAPKWGSEDSGGNFHTIGNVVSYKFPGGDWGAIKADGSEYWDKSPWPSEVAHYWEDQERTITEESWSYVGEYVCHSGNKTGTSCGNVSAVNETITPSGYTVYHTTKFGQVCTFEGDSGGPVFAGHVALGIYSSSTGESSPGACDATSYYTEITEATTSMGVSVGPRVSPPPPPPPANPPIVQTTPATNIQEEQATLNGTVNPNGSETFYHFDYGKTSTYGSRLPAGSDAGAGASTQNLAMYLPVALQPRTQYHYRLVATNAGGTSYGADHIFTTGVRWLIRNANSNGNPEVGFWLGLPSERQVSGDWDGNGTTTGGTYNPTTGVWKLRNSNTTGKPDVEFQYGGAIWTEPVVGDWNNDGKTTVGVYDPTGNTWRLRNSNTPGNADIEFNFGFTAGAKVVSGDWNGDGTSTVGLYDPNGNWRLRTTNATTSSLIVIAYGGAIWTEPVVGDWNNDGKATIGVYDPSGGVWRLRNVNNAGNAEIEFQYGGVGSGPNIFKPLSGDWDGDGDETIALAKVQAETLNEYRLRNTNTAGNADVDFEFDVYGTKQVTGDWNGDGIDTTGSYNPTTGVWKLRNSNTSGYADIEFNFSLATGSKPIAGDWNGDGVDTVGLYSPSGNWKLRATNATTSTSTEIAYGGAIWTEPIVGDWDGNKTETIGVFDPNSGVWRLRNQNTPGNAEIEVQYGGAIWTTPVAGDWNGDGKATIGVFDSGATSNVWRLRNFNTPGNAEIEVLYGGNVWAPITGDWNGDGKDTIGVTTR